MSAKDNVRKLLHDSEHGDRNAQLLEKYLSNPKKREVLLATLSSLDEELAVYENIELTPIEHEAYMLVVEHGVATVKDISSLSDRYASFKHRSHISDIMTSLIAKGLVGRIKVRGSIAYATPKESVMWAVKELGQLPRTSNPQEIADLTGLPLIKVLEVLHTY